jgi:hypothetical protein
VILLAWLAVGTYLFCAVIVIAGAHAIAKRISRDSAVAKYMLLAGVAAILAVGGYQLWRREQVSHNLTSDAEKAALTAYLKSHDSASPPIERDARNASIRGRIIAVMADGHIEPARVPEIILVKIWDASGDHQTLAHQKLESVLPERYKAAQSIKCSLLYSTYSLARSSARSGTGAVTSEVVELKGDEEGNFEAQHLDEGQYRLVAIGQAGWYRNILWDDSFEVENSDNAKVIVKSVARACR